MEILQHGQSPINRTLHDRKQFTISSPYDVILSAIIDVSSILQTIMVKNIFKIIETIDFVVFFSRGGGPSASRWLRT